MPPLLPQVFYGYWVPVDPDDVPDYGEDRETGLVEYESATMPVFLPQSVDALRVRAGYPLGKIGEEYYRCSGESEGGDAGPHLPGGNQTSGVGTRMFQGKGAVLAWMKG